MLELVFELKLSVQRCSIHVRLEKGQGTQQATLLVGYPPIRGIRHPTQPWGKDLIPLPLTCRIISIKHVKTGMLVCHDACPDHQTTSPIVVIFDNVREPISTPGSSRDDITSQVSLQSES
ncbi:hypothetical protein TNCV_4900461 [Trichonephila clavipes]|nr:hypothetical protein TNCV_4900461 [Trichonephila clavipes]